MTDSPERRVECPRHHLLFQVVAEGIAIKCRAGECRAVYVVPWAEIEAKRAEMQGQLPATCVGDRMRA